MTSPFILATASINTTAAAIESNSALISQVVTEALSHNVKLLLLPELCLSGYGAEDLFLSEDFANQCEHALQIICENLPEQLYVAVGFPLWLKKNSVFNATALLCKNKILGIACKQYLADDGIHYEPRWFTPWPKNQIASIEFAGQVVEVGDMLLDIEGKKIGFEICEDAWVHHRPAASLAKKGVDIILNPSASHFALGKQAIRERIVLEAVQNYGCVYAYANLLGCEAGRAVYDGGNLIAQGSTFLRKGERFSFKPYTLELAEINFNKTPTHKAQTKISSTIDKAHNDAEEAALAASLGLWDWLRKTRTQGFTVSLSGGADSALCASLVYLSQLGACLELGIEDYARELQSLNILNENCLKNSNQTDVIAWVAETVMPRLLTTVYQGSDNSSALTHDAAAQLAKAINCRHHVWSISSLVNDYVQRAEEALGETLSFEQDDIALQNIQARVRSPGVWLLANKENKLLLATSNLSEASVGYCTMDGDTSGVLAPIGGMGKTLVLAINQLLEKTGVRLSKHVIKIPALKKINQQQPTAELRPQAQSDEADLMPYEILDSIRKLAQVHFMSTKQIANELQKNMGRDYDSAELLAWVEKYFALYKRNQWKRERLACSFHIETDSACPKTYRRFPVLNHD